MSYPGPPASRMRTLLQQQPAPVVLEPAVPPEPAPVVEVPAEVPTPVVAEAEATAPAQWNPKMLKADLYALAKSLGLSVPDDMAEITKAQLVDLLTAAGA